MKIRPAVGLLTLTALWLTAACSLLGDRRAEAQSIDRQIRSMPGVVETNLHYRWTPFSIDYFAVDVRLAPDVTDTQAADVGKAFANQMNRVRFEGHDTVRLFLRLPRSSNNEHVPDYSQAEFWFDPAQDELWPGPDQLTDSAAMWLGAARSPATTLVNLTQPWGDSKLTRGITLVLKTDATDEQIAALEHDVSGRAEVTWQYSLVADATHPPHDYLTSPAPPTDTGKSLFTQINGMLDAADELRVYTDVSDKPQYSNTRVTVHIADGPDAKERTYRTAESVAQLLPGFGEETKLTISGGGESASIVVGGCTFHEGYYDPSELERDLSEKFETC